MKLGRPAIRLTAGWLARWAVAPALAGAVLGATIDPSALPGSGVERLRAVFLVDGESYFGHLDDPLGSDTLTLRDVYYFQSTAPGSKDAQVVLARRGTEVHRPADGMRIRRDKVLLIEHVRLDSAVARAIAVDRYVVRTSAPK